MRLGNGNIELYTPRNTTAGLCCGVPLTPPPKERMKRRQTEMMQGTVERLAMQRRQQH
jgi:hypothetical protein